MPEHPNSLTLFFGDGNGDAQVLPCFLPCPPGFAIFHVDAIAGQQKRKSAILAACEEREPSAFTDCPCSNRA
ncbi:hypothetical protein XA68_10750 [Ophiocordyceps unilateralis]|uniref:Uncharacterized protein n=1 Tax=Ophiocordyceps unilateralis TaxID=268505 RepID=A0A2A9NYH1_OPHUN|nr:hypothetical protein XA68_10750 [Ophiocordyceps unilateralis]